MKTNAHSKGFCLKRINRGGVATLLVAALLAGCSEKSETPQTPAKGPAPARDKVVIKGSNTVGEELAPRLIAEYQKDHPGAKFDLESNGTGSGFSGLVAGACDIAAASRVIIEGELEQARAHRVEMNEHVIGSYSVAVVVNAASPVANLTKDQVRDLFTGQVQNWKEVGGPDAPVHLYIRDPVSGTYLGFQELAMENKPYAAGATKSTSYAEIVQAVAGDPNGIGYASLQLGMKPGVKAVSIGGVPAAASAVTEGKYPFARVLHLYTNKAKEAPNALAFIQFVQSTRGQAIVDEMGFVPHP